VSCQRTPIPRRLGLSLLAAALLALGPAWSADDELDAAVAALQKRYASVNTITARFQQNYRAPGIEQSESGVFWMKKPGLMRWEYQKPETKLFVADGDETFLYVPADRQVVVSKFSASELHSTPLQFLLGQGNLLASFSASWETVSASRHPGTVLLRLTPRSREADYSHLIVEADAAIFDIRRMVIHERTGNTSEFVLSDVATNVKVPDKQFDFKVPRGVEIVRLDEK
jgi:outer membrane lipoprotein carrier protein